MNIAILTKVPAEADLYLGTARGSLLLVWCRASSLLAQPVDKYVKLLIIEAQPPLDCGAFRGWVHIVPYGVLYLGVSHLDVVVRSLPFVGTERSRITLAQEAPILDGSGRQVMACRQHGLVQEHIV